MADSKITALTALTGANVATGDAMLVTDVSDTTQDASGTSKQITADELAAAILRLRPPRPGSLALPSGALAATFPRGAAATAGQAAWTSGTLHLTAIDLMAGQVITSIGFRTGATGATAPTHQFFGIADVNRAVQRWTNDDTTTAWAATTNKVLNLTSTYTVPTTGMYYLAALVTVTTTMPQPVCFTGNTNIASITPITQGSTSDTGLTTPPTLPFTAGAITVNANVPYGWVL